MRTMTQTYGRAHVARQMRGNRSNALFWAACRATEAGIVDLDPQGTHWHHAVPQSPPTRP